MGLLSHDEILKLHAAIVSARLTGCRAALLVGIDPALVASVPVAPSAAAQVLADLDALNTAGTLEDGCVPLTIMLRNAVALAGPRKEAGVFRRALEWRPCAPEAGGDLRVVDVCVIDDPREIRQLRRKWLASASPESQSTPGESARRHATAASKEALEEQGEFPFLDIVVRNVADVPCVLKGLEYSVCAARRVENEFSPEALPVSWEYNLLIGRERQGVLKLRQVVEPKRADRFLIAVGHADFNLRHLDCEVDLRVLYNEDSSIALGRVALRVCGPIWMHPVKEPAEVRFVPPKKGKTKRTGTRVRKPERSP